MNLGGGTKIYSIASTVELGKMSSEYVLGREAENLKQYKKQALETDMRVPVPNKELGGPFTTKVIVKGEAGLWRGAPEGSFLS